MFFDYLKTTTFLYVKKLIINIYYLSSIYLYINPTFYSIIYICFLKIKIKNKIHEFSFSPINKICIIRYIIIYINQFSVKIYYLIFLHNFPSHFFFNYIIKYFLYLSFWYLYEYLSFLLINPNNLLIFK